jgi:hypothetical protein
VPVAIDGCRDGKAKIGLRDCKCHQRPKERNDTGKNPRRNGHRIEPVAHRIVMEDCGPYPAIMLLVAEIEMRPADVTEPRERFL